MSKIEMIFWYCAAALFGGVAIAAIITGTVRGWCLCFIIENIVLFIFSMVNAIVAHKAGNQYG